MKYPWLDEFLRSKQGTVKDYKEEWEWDRYLVGNKMFAAICKNAGKDQIITLKLAPLDGEFLRNQYDDITPGYYMNKVHWNSINLDGEVPDDLLMDLIDKSYQLIFAGLTKKLQSQIGTIDAEETINEVVEELEQKT